MKDLKKFGLGAIAALALAALVGACVASAEGGEYTEWCESTTVPCPEEEQVEPEGEAGIVIKGKLVANTTLVLTTAGGAANPVITCKTSNTRDEAMPGKQKGPILGEFVQMSLEACTTNAGKTECTVAPINLPWKSEAEGSGKGDGNGTVKLSKDVNGDPWAEATCEGLPKCKYSATSMSLAFMGGATAKMEAKKVQVTSTGGACPKTGEFSATWELSPANLFLNKN